MKVDLSGAYPNNPKRRFPKKGQQESKAAANKPLKTYAQKPAVQEAKIADQPLVKVTNVGEGTPKMVPHQGGSFGGPAEAFPVHPPRGAKLGPAAALHGFGHTPQQKLGKMRISGHPSAHRIGKR